MLSKKRQILFDVMGERTRQARARAEGTPVQISAPPRRPVATFKPRLPKMSRAAAAWCAGAGLTVILVVVVVWAAGRGGGPQTPMLGAPATPAAAGALDQRPQPSAQTFAVCALALDYRNRAERKLVAEKVQETVNFLGYHPDPDFRDVRGEPGKDPETGTFRVYVGSARSRTDLVPLRNKLAMVERKRTRPFKDATVQLISAAAKSAKEAKR